MRRAIVALMLLIAAPSAAAADKVAKIGFLSFWPPTMSAQLGYLRDRLRELGYVEGRNIEIEAYFAAGDLTRTREIARSLIKEPVDVIVTNTGTATRIVKGLTSTIPIVMAPVASAVEAGLVDSLSHPEKNVTGISTEETDITGKWVQYLHDINPSLHAIGFLGRAGGLSPFVAVAKAASDRTGLSLLVRLVNGPGSIDAALFGSLKREGAEAVIVQPIFTGYQDIVVPLATRAGLPVASSYAEFAEAGALLTYGIDDRAVMRHAGAYVDRILHGAKPADLPVEQPTTFQLTINLKAAKHFGWAVPQQLLLQADRVIQ